MASSVFFIPLSKHSDDRERSDAGRRILTALLEKSGGIAPELPLKLHFGERGNRTFLAPAV